jgi:hypothetical protein
LDAVVIPEVGPLNDVERRELCELSPEEFEADLGPLRAVYVGLVPQDSLSSAIEG